MSWGLYLLDWCDPMSACLKRPQRLRGLILSPEFLNPYSSTDSVSSSSKIGNSNSVVANTSDLTHSFIEGRYRLSWQLPSITHWKIGIKPTHDINRHLLTPVPPSVPISSSKYLNAIPIEKKARLIPYIFFNCSSVKKVEICSHISKGMSDVVAAGWRLIGRRVQGKSEEMCFKTQAIYWSAAAPDSQLRISPPLLLRARTSLNTAMGINIYLQFRPFLNTGFLRPRILDSTERPSRE